MVRNKKTVSILTVAKESGYSKTTVGNVLSGQAKKCGVADTTAEKVREVAKRLGYVPNHMARSLRQKRTGIISVLFTTLKMGWAEKALQGIEEVLRQHHYSTVILCHSQDYLRDTSGDDSSCDKVFSILQRRDEGVIFQPSPKNKKDYLELESSLIPTVFMGSLLNDMRGLEQLSSAVWDCGPAAETAVQYLIDTGRKRIGFVGSQHGVQSDTIRYDSYCNVLQEAGIEIHPDWVLWGKPYSPPSVEEFKTVLCGNSQRPDAFFVINDLQAVNTLDILDTLGLKVPDDVAVIGMGDLDVCGLHSINLTTMREPIEEIGSVSAETVLELITHQNREPIHRKVPCNEIRIRGTA